MEVDDPLLGGIRMRSRGRLPHWDAEDGVQFITFRLGDSLPQTVLAELEEEREALRRKMESERRTLTAAERSSVLRLFNERIDGYLDNGVGSCHLGSPRVARMMLGALLHFHGSRYRMHACCVMPNHVHVVAALRQPWTLDDVLHSWKSYSANVANRMLGREGEFWAREYYDHLIRDEEDHGRLVEYTLTNPESAGLENWPFVWYDGGQL